MRASIADVQHGTVGGRENQATGQRTGPPAKLAMKLGVSHSVIAIALEAGQSQASSHRAVYGFQLP
jgi:hypothetical protein